MTELSETIELMQSEDFKERFKAEYWQTKIRHDKLAEMLKKYKAGTLAFEPKSTEALLTLQMSVMEKYLFALEERARIEEIDLNGGGRNDGRHENTGIQAGRPRSRITQ